MLLFGYVAWGLYKLSIKAWWCAVLLTILWALSTGITFSRVNMLDFYQKMNFPQQQLEIMKQCMPQAFTSTMALFFSLWFVGFLVYLLYTKKYFAS
jgi:flagellar biosynthesis protein FlhB